MTPTKEPSAVEERMKIVVWLRDQQLIGEEQDDLADAIERGDHDTAEPKRCSVCFCLTPVTAKEPE
jgi:hypothetical protein